MASQFSQVDPVLTSILVTGGCGFVGSHIVRLILERNPSASVAVVDLHTSRNQHPKATYYRCDITSAYDVRRVLETTRPSVVIHAASPVFGNKQGAEELMRKVNVGGTKVLLEEARGAGVEVFVYTSSASVASDNRTNLVNADERWTVIRGEAQKEFYTDTKAEAEGLVLAANTRRPTPFSTEKPTSFLTTALRPAGIFGENDAQYTPGALGVLKSGKTGFQIGSNDNLWDYSYVGNVAHAHLLAAQKLLALAQKLKERPGELIGDEDDDKDDQKKSLRVDGRMFNITNGTPVYWWDLMRALWMAYATLSQTSNISTSTVIPAHLRVAYPTPPNKAFVLPMWLAIIFANFAVIFNTLLGRPEGTFTPSKIIFTGMTRYFSLVRAERCLGYSPIWSLEEGVERTARWAWEADLEEAAKKGR